MRDVPSVRRFLENNWEKMLLWAILIGLFYLLRPFFLLIFLTFLITYVTRSIVEWTVNRLKLNYRMTTAGVFLLLIGLLCGAGAWIGPKLIVQSNRVLAEITVGGEVAEDRINHVVERFVVRVIGEEKGANFIESGDYDALMESLKTEAAKAMKTALPHVLQTIVYVVKLGWQFMISLLLAIIFSCILVMDWRRIAGKMKELERSRIRTFYHGAAPHLQAFAEVLGKALRAQTVIAICNTVLTAAGLWFFGVPNLALLSTIVFLCGFVPILGTFLSSIPIMLFGAQVGGLPLVLKLIGLVAIVHAIEAYVLNPRITAGVLHVHPMLVLVLLLIGERFFGIWGMVVGVPIGYYLISVLTQREESPGAEPEAGGAA